MAATQSPTKRGPGRPRKNTKPDASTTGAITKRPRGRPARNATHPGAKPTASTRSTTEVRHSPRKAAMAEATAKIEASSPTKRKRGRPASTTTTTKSTTAAPKPRGRPPKSAQTSVKDTKPVQSASSSSTSSVYIQGLEKRVKQLETRLTRLERAGHKSSKSNNGNYEDFEARLARLEENAEYLTDVEADAIPSTEDDDEEEDEDEVMGNGINGDIIIPATQSIDAEGKVATNSDDIPYASPNSDNRRDMIMEELIVQEVELDSGRNVREQSNGPLGRPENPHAVGLFADIISRFGSPIRQSPARTLA